MSGKSRTSTRDQAKNEGAVYADSLVVLGLPNSVTVTVSGSDSSVSTSVNGGVTTWTPLGTGEDHTCGNWMSNGAGSAQVGHHDRQGGGDNPTSWGTAHASRGCSQDDLIGTGGDGLYYCFATN